LRKVGDGERGMQVYGRISGGDGFERLMYSRRRRRRRSGAVPKSMSPRDG
jgi:hypothetical protein